nr:MULTISPECIES: DUF6434 domain-containing protein [unclassified Mesorhizobium]
MNVFDWHADPISCAAPITKSYRNTQNVRRYFTPRMRRYVQVRSAFHGLAKGRSGQDNGRRRRRMDQARLAEKRKAWFVLNSPATPPAANHLVLPVFGPKARRVHAQHFRLLSAHVVSPKPLHIFARHALSCGRP